MKYLLVIVVVAVVLWLMFGVRRRQQGSRPATPPRVAPPVVMIECAHCGVHLAPADAVLDARGRPYCGAAHRVAGPR